MSALDAVEVWHRQRREQREAAARVPRSPHPELPANTAARERMEASTAARQPAAVREATERQLDRQRSELDLLRSWQRYRERIRLEAQTAQEAATEALGRGDLDRVVAARLHARELRAVVEPGADLDQIIRSAVAKGIPAPEVAQ